MEQRFQLRFTFAALPHLWGQSLFKTKTLRNEIIWILILIISIAKLLQQLKEAKVSERFVRKLSAIVSFDWNIFMKLTKRKLLVSIPSW